MNENWLKIGNFNLFSSQEKLWRQKSNLLEVTLWFVEHMLVLDIGIATYFTTFSLRNESNGDLCIVVTWEADECQLQYVSHAWFSEIVQLSMHLSIQSDFSSTT